MNPYLALRAALHDTLGPAAADKAPEILDLLQTAGAYLVPRQITPEFLDEVRRAVTFELLRPQPDTRDPIERAWELAMWRAADVARREGGDRAYNERRKRIDAAVAARVAKLPGTP